MLLLRARTLAQGHSGVRPQVVGKLLEMLERDILPVVPFPGSVGASGDLAPLAHLALPVSAEGMGKLEGRVVATAAPGTAPIRRGTKDGLGASRATQGITAMRAL